MDTLRVRIYSVRFGDAILVSVPDRNDGTTTMRHILIDVGNSTAGEGGRNEVFGDVVEDIRSVLQGRPLDLYVMTHEHMDHVQGLLWAEEQKGLRLDVDYAWLTASAAQDYHRTHPEAVERKGHRDTLLARAASLLAAMPSPPVELQALLANNASDSTDPCVDYLRHLAKVKTSYVYRGARLAGTHPFREARLRIWAPEKSPTAYYGRQRFLPMAAGVLTREQVGEGHSQPALLPPAGVDAGAFYDLLDSRSRGIYDNLTLIDKAANNTSIVFSLEWRGWTLLFAGDAEERSWLEMAKHNVLRPVHFLKVSHHGSETGNPPDPILERILPMPKPGPRPRYAAASTNVGKPYESVPNQELIEDKVGSRLDKPFWWVKKETVPDGHYQDIPFDDPA